MDLFSYLTFSFFSFCPLQRLGSSQRNFFWLSLYPITFCDLVEVQHMRLDMVELLDSVTTL